MILEIIQKWILNTERRTWSVYSCRWKCTWI